MRRLLLALLSLWALHMATGDRPLPKPKFVPHEGLKKIICHARPSYGKCKGHRTMYYYLPTYHTCREFDFSNCAGNRNRFFSYEECMDYCGQEPIVQRTLILPPEVFEMG